VRAVIICARNDHLKTVSFYDALNRRIGIKDNGTQTWTVYDGSIPYADFNGSGTLLSRYLYAPAVDELLARTSSGGSIAWYLTDKDGGVETICDSGGDILNQVVYDSYGQIVTETTPANGDRFKYADMEYDPAVGIYYDRARSYNPATGRFLQQDPLGLAAGDVNIYRYVGNNPVTLSDPSGLKPVVTETEVNDSAPPSASSGPKNSSPDDCCRCCCEKITVEFNSFIGSSLGNQQKEPYDNPFGTQYYYQTDQRMFGTKGTSRIFSHITFDTCKIGSLPHVLARAGRVGPSTCIAGGGPDNWPIPPGGGVVIVNNTSGSVRGVMGPGGKFKPVGPPVFTKVRCDLVHVFNHEDQKGSTIIVDNIRGNHPFTPNSPNINMDITLKIRQDKKCGDIVIEIKARRDNFPFYELVVERGGTRQVVTKYDATAEGGPGLRNLNSRGTMNATVTVKKSCHEEGCGCGN
jgi:RHS repeat-associated protein